MVCTSILSVRGCVIFVDGTLALGVNLTVDVGLKFARSCTTCGVAPHPGGRSTILYRGCVASPFLQALLPLEVERSQYQTPGLFFSCFSLKTGSGQDGRGGLQAHFLGFGRAGENLYGQTYLYRAPLLDFVTPLMSQWSSAFGKPHHPDRLPSVLMHVVHQHPRQKKLSSWP